MALLCLVLHIATTKHVSIFVHPLFFRSCRTVNPREIKEWILVDMWDIKKVLESEGDVHVKVEIQSNSEFQSLTSSSTRSL
jgi:hypothetical protein